MILMNAVDAEPVCPCISLIGPRGCGKTKVGKLLADWLGGRCVDTDDLITRHSGRTIAAIFAYEGEAGFRRWERKAIEQVTTAPPAVVSVGGGAVVDERNIEALRQVSKVVWLTAPVETLWQRISSDEASGDTRPPLTDVGGREELERILAERSPLYERAADLMVDTATLTPDQVVEQIAAGLGLQAA